MFIKHILLSLLILCITTLAYGKDTKADSAHYTNDGSNTAIITNTLADIDNLSGLSPLDVIKNPNLLDDKWDLKPISLSTYTEEEKQLQQLINDKTTTAVKTYSTPEQSKEWTKYDHEEITPYTWKIVELALTEANGKTFNVTLLRPNWWILNIGADRKGNRFYLKIPEVAEGSALVTNIRANQLDTRLWNEQRDGDYVYRPITATFEHESSQVLNLYFANNKEPIGVTAEHPFYSLDRQDFVRADNLSIGEKVKTHQGQTALLDKTKLEGTHKVYNIEVYKDHNYMVSMDSLLVHNKGVGGKLTFQVDPSLTKDDELAGVLKNGVYVKNPTARPVIEMISQSGRVGNKQTNGQFMYVITTKGEIIIGTRGKDLTTGENLKMPHPTLIGGKDPQVLGAGMVDIRAGKIHSVNLESGHFKPSNDSLEAVKEAFEKLPPNVFDKNFKGYQPYKED